MRFTIIFPTLIGGACGTTTSTWNGTAWSNLSSLATGRRVLAGGGTQPASFAAGGKTTVAVGDTEEWNFGVYSYSAAAWASGGNMGTARYALAGAGTQASALAFGGTPPSAGLASTEEFTGPSVSLQTRTITTS